MNSRFFSCQRRRPRILAALNALGVLAIATTLLLAPPHSVRAASGGIVTATDDERRDVPAYVADWFDDEGDIDIARVYASLTPDVRAYIAHVTTLANPFFEGRAPGTRGNRIAAEYIEFWFKYFGLAPAFPDVDDDGAQLTESQWVSYRQPFTMPGGMSTVHEALSFEKGEEDRSFVAGREFAALGVGEGDVTARLAFVGYGIERGPRDFADYNSFGGLDDLEGRIAVLLRFEPSGEDGLSQWRDGQKGWSPRASIDAKMRAVVRHKAAGVILVHPPGTHDPRTNELLSAEVSSWRRIGIPAVHMSIAAADELLRLAAGGKSLAEFKLMADAAQPEAVLLDDDLVVTISTKLQRQANETDNVGGILRGRGELKDQWLIIGAHYDHLGYGGFGSLGGRAASGTIHPGADDNGSGTSGVILLAQRLASLYGEMDPDQDRRSILFMTFSAEESGLNGSRHYVNHPTLTPDQVTMMINLDMIGRLRNNTFELGGTGSADDLGDLLDPHIERSGINVTRNPSGLGPSDHTSFYAKSIPVLFFFTGLHDVYHTPRDVASTINSVGAVKVLDLVQDITVDLVTRPEMLTFASSSRRTRRLQPGGPPPDDGAVVEGGDDATPRPARTAMKVRLGIRPASYEEGGDGIMVGGVTDDSSAAEAGLKEGDLIISWGGVELADVGDLMGQMINHEPGDKVVLGVIREGKKIDITVTLKANDLADRM